MDKSVRADQGELTTTKFRTSYSNARSTFGRQHIKLNKYIACSVHCTIKTLMCVVVLLIMLPIIVPHDLNKMVMGYYRYYRDIPT